MKNMRPCCLAAIIQSALLVLACPVARAQSTATDGYVTRKEYEELKAQMLAMKKELDALKQEKGAAPKQESAQSQTVADTHKQVATEAPPPAVEAEAPMRGTTERLLAGRTQGMH